SARAKDVSYFLSKSKIKIRLQDSLLLEGELLHDVRPDECTWTLENSLNDSKLLCVVLEKLDTMTWWDRVLKDSSEFIDTAKIIPDDSKLGDLDGETRGMVEKMMFDQRQKALGLPTSDDLKKKEMLEGFMRANPNLDFSNAKLS